MSEITSGVADVIATRRESTSDGDTLDARKRTLTANVLDNSPPTKVGSKSRISILGDKASAAIARPSIRATMPDITASANPVSLADGSTPFVVNWTLMTITGFVGADVGVEDGARVGATVI